MILPSKELLSVVLGEEVKDLELWNQNNIRYFSPKDYIINVHELAYKCKEWSLINGHILKSWTTKPAHSGVEAYCKSNNIDRFPFQADTEPEAVFKACEYILQQERLDK